MRKKKQVPNPHDAFFRQTLQRPGVAAEFLRLYLPEDIVAQLDLSRVALEDGAFVDEKLREHFSDLLYRVGLKGGGDAFVFFLLEHKSAPDERVMLQLLRYMVLAWDRLPLPLPLIVPVVVYHGASPWRLSERLSGLFAPSASEPIWRGYLPDFRHHLLDFTRYRDADLRGGKGLSAALKLLKHVFSRELPERLPEIFSEAVQTSSSESEAQTQVLTMISYLNESERVSQAQISNALFATVSEGDQMETILEKIIRESIEARSPEFLEYDEQKAQRAMAATMTLDQLRLQVGRLDRETTEKIRALPVASLKRLGKALLRFETRADLDAWLRRNVAKRPAKRWVRRSASNGGN